MSTFTAQDRADDRCRQYVVCDGITVKIFPCVDGPAILTDCLTDRLIRRYGDEEYQNRLLSFDEVREVVESDRFLDQLRNPVVILRLTKGQIVEEHHIQIMTTCIKQAPGSSTDVYPEWSNNVTFVPIDLTNPDFRHRRLAGLLGKITDETIVRLALREETVRNEMVAAQFAQLAAISTYYVPSPASSQPESSSDRPGSRRQPQEPQVHAWTLLAKIIEGGYSSLAPIVAIRSPEITQDAEHNLRDLIASAAVSHRCLVNLTFEWERPETKFELQVENFQQVLLGCLGANGIEHAFDLSKGEVMCLCNHMISQSLFMAFRCKLMLRLAELHDQLALLPDPEHQSAYADFAADVTKLVAGTAEELDSHIKTVAETRDPTGGASIPADPTCWFFSGPFTLCYNDSVPFDASLLHQGIVDCVFPILSRRSRRVVQWPILGNFFGRGANPGRPEPVDPTPGSVRLDGFNDTSRHLDGLVHRPARPIDGPSHYPDGHIDGPLRPDGPLHLDGHVIRSLDGPQGHAAGFLTSPDDQFDSSGRLLPPDYNLDFDENVFFNMYHSNRGARNAQVRAAIRRILSQENWAPLDDDEF